MAEVRVLLRDTETGEEAWYVDEGESVDGVEFYWHDGNGGCDCERLRCLHAALGRSDPNIGCGSSRVIIAEATVDGVKQDWQ